MFYELVVRKVLLVTLYNKQTFLAAKIEKKNANQTKQDVEQRTKNGIYCEPFVYIYGRRECNTTGCCEMQIQAE